MGTGTGTGNLLFFLVVLEPVSEKFGTEKVLQPVSNRFGIEKTPGTGLGKFWYRKKVSESVSEKIGTGKKSRNRYWKNFVPELIFVVKIW